MNAAAVTGILNPSADPARQRLSRNVVIAVAVLALHAGLIWALQTGLLLHTAELLVPAEVLAQLIEPPAPKPEPAPPPAIVPPPRTVRPAPSVQKKTTPKPEVRPQPAAIADPAPAPNAPTGTLAPVVPVVPVAPAPPSAESAAPIASAAPAPPPAAVQLPSSNADYLQNPKPAYPPLSKRLGEQGKVIVRVLIGADGVPQKGEIRQSSGFDRLDQAALATALKWRYGPGKRGGVAEDMWFNVPINFVLD